MTKAEYECFQLYMALKAYFQNKFDFFKYGGKIKINPKTYEARKDRFFFQKLSKKYSREQLTLFFVANFVHSSDRKWVGELLSEQSETIYFNIKKVHDSLSYFFEQDCATISTFLEYNPNFYNLFKMKYSNKLSPQTWPPILGMDITYESIIILNNIVRFVGQPRPSTPFEVISSNPDISPLWEAEDRPILEKYAPFINYKASDMLKIFNKYFQRDRVDALDLQASSG